MEEQQQYRNKEILDDDYKFTERANSLEAQLDQSIAKNAMYIPAFKTSQAMAKRYNNPNIAFNPNVNMEEIYAKSDPFTLGDALSKTKRLFTEQVGQSWMSLVDGAFTAVNTGDVSKLWDNETNSNVADAMAAVEELFPQYQTQDQQDNPGALRNWGNTFKTFLPSSASAGAMMADAVLTELVFIGVGAATGYGVGAIPGAAAGLARIAARAPKYFKDIRTLSNAIADGITAVRAWKAGRAIKSTLPSGKMVMSGFIAANGEAGLQAKMASSELMQSEVNKYMELYGKPPDQATFDQIEANGKELEKKVWQMNVPVLMTSNLIQLGNIFKGTKLANAGITSLQRSGGKLGYNGWKAGRKYLWNLGKSSFSEGLEEYYQGASTSAAQQHFSIFTKDSKSYTDRFFKEVSHRWTTQEGQMEFAGGAVIGGMFTGVGSLYGTRNDYNRYKQLANVSNSSTQALYQQYGQNEALTDQIVKDVEENKISKATFGINKNIFNLAKMHKNNDTWASMDSNFDDMKRMEVAEFNEVYDTKFTQAEKDQIVGQVQKKFNMALEASAVTDKYLQYNPLLQDPRFKELSRKVKGVETQKSDLLWGKIKDSFTEMIYNQEMFGLEEANAAFTIDNDPTISNDIQGLLNFQDGDIDTWLKTKLQEAEAMSKPNATLLKIKDAGSYSEKLGMILNDYYKLDGEAKDKVNNLLTIRGMLKTIGDTVEGFNDPEQLYQNAKEVADWMEYLDVNGLDTVGQEDQHAPTEPIETPVEEESEPEQKSYNDVRDDIDNASEIGLDNISVDHLPSKQKKAAKEAIQTKKDNIRGDKIKAEYNAKPKTKENLDKLIAEDEFPGKTVEVEAFKQKVLSKTVDKVLAKIAKAKLEDLDIVLEFGPHNRRVKKAIQARKNKLASGQTQVEQVQVNRKTNIEKITMAEQEAAYQKGQSMTPEEALADLMRIHKENC